jgi:hypothetical protein
MGLDEGPRDKEPPIQEHDAERPPPELTRRRAMAEASEWTYDPWAADLPLMDPLTI